MRDYVADKKREGLSPRTVQYHIALVRRALHVAESHSLIEKNVARLVSAPQVKRPEVLPLTSAQCGEFLAAIKGDRLEALYVTAMATGLRQSELLGLAWVDIDFDAATLTVRQTLQRYHGTFHLDPPKTDKSRRTLALPQPVVKVLRGHRDRQGFERVAAGTGWDSEGCGLVFVDPTGAPLLGSQVTRTFQAILRREGLPRVRFHDLRHGAATYLLAAGVDLKVVQEVLGHTTIHTTANTYAHVGPQLRRDAADRIGAVLFGSVAQ